MAKNSIRDLVRADARAALRSGGAQARDLANGFVGANGEMLEEAKASIFVEWATGLYRDALKARPEQTGQLFFPGFDVLDRGVLAPAPEGGVPRYKLVRDLRLKDLAGAIEMILGQAASIRESAKDLQAFHSKLTAAGCGPDDMIEAFISRSILRAAE